MTDPIVYEVRRFRTEHAMKFDPDLHAICADIRQFEASCGHELRNCRRRSWQRWKHQ